MTGGSNSYRVSTKGLYCVVDHKWSTRRDFTVSMRKIIIFELITKILKSVFWACNSGNRKTAKWRVKPFEGRVLRNYSRWSQHEQIMGVNYDTLSGGVCRTVLKTLNLSQTKIYDFPWLDGRCGVRSIFRRFFNEPCEVHCSETTMANVAVFSPRFFHLNWAISGSAMHFLRTSFGRGNICRNKIKVETSHVGAIWGFVWDYGGIK